MEKEGQNALEVEEEAQEETEESPEEESGRAISLASVFVILWTETNTMQNLIAA
ncbi:MAG: hypothetical protein ACHQX1_00840 [Candidatus Micrarchaeales archaeon]